MEVFGLDLPEFARKEHISYSLSFRIQRLEPNFASNSATA
jgi:hypothetical protein